MYGRVSPTANHRDPVFTAADIKRLRRAERAAAFWEWADYVSRAVWWSALVLTCAVLGACAGYLVPLVLPELQ